MPEANSTPSGLRRTMRGLLVASTTALVGVGVWLEAARGDEQSLLFSLNGQRTSAQDDWFWRAEALRLGRTLRLNVTRSTYSYADDSVRTRAPPAPPPGWQPPRDDFR